MDHPEDFHHPYSPYDIQLQFMKALYASLEESKVAVFESPTGKSPEPHSSAVSNTDSGTVSLANMALVRQDQFVSDRMQGKSLSLICGSLTWLRDHKRKTLQESVANTTCEDSECEFVWICSN